MRNYFCNSLFLFLHFFLKNPFPVLVAALSLCYHECNKHKCKIEARHSSVFMDRTPESVYAIMKGFAAEGVRNPEPY